MVHCLRLSVLGLFPRRVDVLLTAIKTAGLILLSLDILVVDADGLINLLTQSIVILGPVSLN